MRTLRTLACLVALSLQACDCSGAVPATVGEACGPTRGCEDGLTCRQSVCVLLDGQGGGSAGGDAGGAGGGAVGGGAAGGTAGGSAGGGSAGGGSAGGGSAGGGSAGGGSAGGGSAGGGSAGGGSAGGGSSGCGACNTPPGICFGASGVCVNGACQYPFSAGACDDGDPCTDADACNAGLCQGAPKNCPAPANVCSNASTLRVYGAGTCSAGTCGSTSTYVSCSAGCSGGRCNASQWVTMASGSNTTLYSVWGSSPTAVWAGGTNGTMLFYNGTAWSARASGVTDSVWSISGTTANDVFATTGHDVLHYDGVSWSKVAPALAPPGDTAIGSVQAVGPQEAVAQTVNPSSLCRGLLVRVKYTGGAWVVTNPLGCVGSEPTSLYDYTSSLWAAGANDVYFGSTGVHRWSSGQLTAPGGSADAGTSAKYTHALWGTAANNVYAGQFGGVARWNGSSWAFVNNGHTGEVTGISGISPNRFFTSVAYYVGPGASDYAGAVLSYDGQGFTQELLPANTRDLNAIWDGATVTIAVGKGGTIVRSP